MCCFSSLVLLSATGNTNSGENGWLGYIYLSFVLLFAIGIPNWSKKLDGEVRITIH